MPIGKRVISLERARRKKKRKTKRKDDESADAEPQLGELDKKYRELLVESTVLL